MWFKSQEHFHPISHTHRNRTETETEKFKCLNTYECFHIYTETERRTENVHELDFIFFGLGGRISANTTGDFN